MIILYSTGCPKCNVLKEKLSKKNIEYKENTNIEEMQKLGITSVPVLRVEGIMLSFLDALKWVENNAD